MLIVDKIFPAIMNVECLLKKVGKFLSCNFSILSVTFINLNVILGIFLSISVYSLSERGCIN
jgi:hypothetical protein